MSEQQDQEPGEGIVGQSASTDGFGGMVDAILLSLIGRLYNMADRAYFSGIDQIQSDECLGWEIKIERGKFGASDLKAHCAAAESFGRHRALQEAAAMLSQLLTPNDRVEGRDAASSRRVPSHDGLCGNGNYNERTEK